MNAPNFASILDKPIAEVERPLPMPAGSYVAIVKGQPTYDVSSKKKTPYAEFTYQITSAMDDVDADELKSYEEKHGAITTRSVKNTYYLTEAALFMLKDFLEQCGIDVDEGSIRESIDATPNCEIGFLMIHEPTQDGKGVMARVAKTFSVAAE